MLDLLQDLGELGVQQELPLHHWVQQVQLLQGLYRQILSVQAVQKGQSDVLLVLSFRPPYW